MFETPLDLSGVTSILSPALTDSYVNTSMLPLIETLASLSDIFLLSLSAFKIAFDIIHIHMGFGVISWWHLSFITFILSDFKMALDIPHIHMEFDGKF